MVSKSDRQVRSVAFEIDGFAQADCFLRCVELDRPIRNIRWIIDFTLTTAFACLSTESHLIGNS